MTGKVPAAPWLLIELDLDDQMALEAVGRELGTTVETVHKVANFAQQLLQVAHKQDLDANELIISLLSASSVVIKGCGAPQDQSDLCVKLFERLWASCSVPAQPNDSWTVPPPPSDLFH